jgi:hypothetical protein
MTDEKKGMSKDDKKTAAQRKEALAGWYGICVQYVPVDVAIKVKGRSVII